MNTKNADKAAKFIGFNSFKGYLKSSMWALIESGVLEREGGKCVFCGKDAVCAEHKNLKGVSAKVLIGRSPYFIHSVCNEHKGVLADMKLEDSIPAKPLS